MKISVLLLLFSLIVATQNYCGAQDKGADSATRSKIEELNNLAYESRNSDPTASLSYSVSSLSLSVSAGYSVGQINALLLMGMVYKNIGSYDKAMASYFNALRIAEDTGDKPRVSSCLNNIGSVYQVQGNFNKALKYYKLSMKIEENLNNNEQISIRLYNMGAVYETMDSLDLAYTYYLNSLLIEEKAGNKEGIYYALYGIAGVDTKMGRFESAMGNISRALNVAKELEDILGISVCYCEMGKLYMAKAQYNKAVTAFDSSLMYANIAGLMNELKDGYQNLAEAYDRLGDSEKAYDNLLRYVAINDSLNSLGIKSRVAEVETRFQVERKEKEIQFLKETNRLKTEKAESERQNRNFLLVTIVLAMLFAVYNLRRIAGNVKMIIILTAGIFIIICLIALLFLFLPSYNYEQSIIGFFKVFADVLTYSVLPLFFFILLMERFLLNRYLRKAGELTDEIRTLSMPEIEKEINLQFEGKDAFMSLRLSDLICFEANDNYTAIYYMKNKMIKKEIQRITLKKLENQLVECEEIVRCHKSFIINIQKVNRVSGNAQGYRLHLQGLDFSIPVSRMFPHSMINMLKARE